MIRNASLVYTSNPLFGTFDDKHGDFQWMTYRDFGRRVDLCRTVLKDLGKISLFDADMFSFIIGIVRWLTLMLFMLKESHPIQK